MNFFPHFSSLWIDSRNNYETNFRKKKFLYITFHNDDNNFFVYLQTSASTKTHVDHQAQAYVAPRKVMTEANGNAPKPIANGKPKWGGAEVCPRCNKSVSTCGIPSLSIILYNLVAKRALLLEKGVSIPFFGLKL